MIPLPSLRDVIYIWLSILGFGFAINFMSVAMLKLTGTSAFLNNGYSMCVYEDPLLEFLPITDDKCSWVPLNMLVLNTHIDKNSLKVGDNVCYWRGFGEYKYLVCHRIVKIKKENGRVEYLIAGLHPKAIREWVSSDKVYAKVIDKLPRAIGGPDLFAAYILHNPLMIYVYINKGGYL